MADRILVPYDGSPPSEEALDHAVEQFPDADIIVLTVSDPVEATYAAGDESRYLGENWFDVASQEAEQTLEVAKRSTDRALETEHVVGKPVRTIVEYATENTIDQIVMGSHGRSGISRVILGSVAEKVLRRSPVPVTIVR